jgi:hypothetical protein
MQTPSPPLDLMSLHMVSCARARRALQEADASLAAARDALRNCRPVSDHFAQCKHAVDLAEERYAAARNAFKESMALRATL